MRCWVGKGVVGVMVYEEMCVYKGLRYVRSLGFGGRECKRELEVVRRWDI